MSDNNFFFLAVILGKNPTKRNCLASNPEAISAVNAALGPGSGITLIPESMASLTKSAPGSEITGIPASLHCATDFPSCSSFIIFGPANFLLCS